MRRRGSISILRWISLLFIFSAVGLVVLQLVKFSQIRGNYSPGLSIAGVPVAGLNRADAGQRLLLTYGTAIEIHFEEAAIQVKPSSLGFELDLEGMLAAADLQRTQENFWVDFWNSLWNHRTDPVDIPLKASVSDDRIRSYLQNEIASRYDTIPTAAEAIAGQVTFQPGQAGSALDLDRAVPLVEDGLRSPLDRKVYIPSSKTSAPRPSFHNLQILLMEIIKNADFEGIAEFVVTDLQTDAQIHFTYQSGATDQPPLDIPFSAYSTIKIPIMISVYRRVSQPLPEDVAAMVQAMLDRSENPPADALMAKAIDPTRGPLEVTQNLQAIGLQNTFLGAWMAKAVFFNKFSTPANQRKDVNTDLDAYNQTTAGDMAALLEDLYQCSDFGGGALIAAFPGEITQAKCQEMINYMANNKIHQLFQAGLPEGTRFAHKHAWANSNDGLIHTIGDVGIAYTPGGNFILTGFMYNAQQLAFDPANQLFAALAEAVNNYFNAPAP